VPSTIFKFKDGGSVRKLKNMDKMEFLNFNYIHNENNNVKDVRWALDVAGKVEVRNNYESSVSLKGRELSEDLGVDVRL
jgi:hypothetical protein